MRRGGLFSHWFGYSILLRLDTIKPAPATAPRAAADATPYRKDHDREEEGVKKEHSLNSFRYIILPGAGNVDGKSPDSCRFACLFARSMIRLETMIYRG
jgi:hypothetical protein